jgi:hypothetical protein
MLQFPNHQVLLQLQVRETHATPARRSLRLRTTTNHLPACKAADDFINARKNTTVIHKSPRIPLRSLHCLSLFIIGCHMRLGSPQPDRTHHIIRRPEQEYHTCPTVTPGAFPEEAPQLCRTMQRHTQLRR